MTSPLRDMAAIVGVGHTPCAKDLGVPGPILTLRTCLEAIADAGLEPGDIDGIAASGLAAWGGGGEPTTSAMTEMLGLPGVHWHGGMLGGSVFPGLVANAAWAVASGLCTTALVYRTMTAPRPDASTYNYMGADGARGDLAFTLPYGLGVVMQSFAPWYQRRRKVYGVTDEQMGAYVVAMRDNATRNPHAALGKSITMDEYLASRFVCEPLRLYDCDMPVDVCGAVVVTTAARARDLRHVPVYVGAVATGTGPRPDMIFTHSYDESGSRWAAETLWNNAGVGPADMDFAMLYDGFAPMVLYGLEDLGLVPKGEAGRFLGDGGHLAGGSLPLNPHGGNNSEGRSHAIGHVIEATLQIRGQAGTRQLSKANSCVVSGGPTSHSGAVVLHN